jgi:tripartite-type tricarboxylate transporter receptor subunit TctC
LYRRLPFEPLRDLAPITLIATAPSLLVVPPSLPVSTVAELIAYLKARPGELNYASYGVGSSPHLGAELFQSMTGTRIVHVPYPGGGPASLGVMGNNVQMLLGGIPSVLGLVRGGQIKAIALAADRRSPLLPDVPTFIESGLDFRSGPWFGLLAPAKTPRELVDKVNAEVRRILDLADVRARLAQLGAAPAGNSPDEFAAYINADVAKWTKLITDLGIRMEN